MKKLAASARAQSEKAGGDGESQKNPSSTKGMMLSLAKRRQQIQEKQKEEEAKKKEEDDRLKQQNQLKGVVQGALKQRFTTPADKIIEEKVQEARKVMREQERKQKEAIAQMVQKGRNRPMLLEQDATYQKNQSNLAFLKATNKMIEILKAHGENPDNYLDDEAKKLLEEQKFKDAQKAIVGKK